VCVCVCVCVCVYVHVCVCVCVRACVHLCMCVSVRSQLSYIVQEISPFLPFSLPFSFSLSFSLSTCVCQRQSVNVLSWAVEIFRLRPSFIVVSSYSWWWLLKYVLLVLYHCYQRLWYNLSRTHTICKTLCFLTNTMRRWHITGFVKFKRLPVCQSWQRKTLWSPVKEVYLNPHSTALRVVNGKGRAEES